MRPMAFLVLALAIGLPSIAMAQAPSAASLPPWRAGPRGDLARAMSAFLLQTAYAKPDQGSRPDGSIGTYDP